MKDHAEAYHPVQSIRRARAAHPLGKSEPTDMTSEHGPVVSTTVTKHDDGSAHVTARHSKGHEVIHQHPNEAAAHDHARDLMSGGDSMNSDGKVDTDECPECGGEMKDGKCQQCGYESKDKAVQALGGDGDNDEY